MRAIAPYIEPNLNISHAQRDLFHANGNYIWTADFLGNKLNFTTHNAAHILNMYYNSQFHRSIQYLPHYYSNFENLENTLPYGQTGFSQLLNSNTDRVINYLSTKADWIVNQCTIQSTEAVNNAITHAL